MRESDSLVVERAAVNAATSLTGAEPETEWSCGDLYCRPKPFLFALALTLIAVPTFTIGSILFRQECSLCYGFRIAASVLGACVGLTCAAWLIFIIRRDSNPHEKQTLIPVSARNTSNKDVDHFDATPLYSPSAFGAGSNPADQESCCTLAKVCFGIAVSWSVLLALLSIAWLAAPIWLHSATKVQLEGTLSLPGLKSSVSIQREPNGMIHIIANNDDDLFFAQGVVNAQERLWQMEFQRRVGAGRLTEVVGNVDAAIKIDKLLRTLGVYRAAGVALAGLSPAAQAAVLSFCAGVNAYLDSKPKLPIEFTIFGYRPQPWQPADVLVWTKMISLQLGLNQEMELLRFHLMVERGLSEQRVDQLIPRYDIQNFPTVLSNQDLAPFNLTSNTHMQAEHEQKLFDADSYFAELRTKAQSSSPSSSSSASTSFSSHKSYADILDDMRQLFGSSRASNNWVVGSNLTASGKPLLSNDPHLSLMAPSIWMQLHLQINNPDGTRKLSVSGVAFIGVPSIVLGHTDYFAWGVTNTGADMQDLYAMDGNTTHYSYQGQMVAYKVRAETIIVKGAAPIQLNVRETVYGPVVTDIQNDAIDGSKGIPLSLRWVSLDANDTVYQAIHDLNFARNYTEVRAAARVFTAPSQNIVWADTQGNIAYMLNGRIPIRAPGHSGLYPVPGNGTYDWQGFLDFDLLPHTYNPPEGFVASANNRVVPSQYPYFIAYDWDDGSTGYRAKRITQRIKDFVAAGKKMTVDDMASIQNDYVTLDARDWLSALQRLSLTTDQAKQWRDILVTWVNETGGDTSPSRTEPSVFVKWVVQLGQLPLKEIGKSKRTTWWNQRYLQNVFVLGQPDSNCGAAGCDAYAAQAFETAVAAVAGKQWGYDLHQASIEHQVLGASPLACLSNRISHHGGTPETVNVGTPDFSDDAWPQKEGPSYRGIFDLSDLQQSKLIYPMGQSGDLFAKHYDDWLQDWTDGKYHPLKTSGYETEFELKLQPAN